ncbi:retrovirus-related Pol polyprotein from transposon 17.6 [Trichonephila inaurata madagascariensis]|uniref:Retrovirus-related Pol polyprotein from transposon 17.6 n=1 Tax=Trichonephila inaurata madagascariensis TaxID=2747483 RepID=A0A8X6KJU2_9ARAC|nr:retrovirus-related Pol polyprotein from transposon 17.6 [Trichonephila inaurata madagascariensis]
MHLRSSRQDYLKIQSYTALTSHNPFIIQCDASNHGIGVVFSQVWKNEEHPIMFLSKMLSLVKQKYSTTDKECAAIIFAVQKLNCYLDGYRSYRSFVIQVIIPLSG